MRNYLLKNVKRKQRMQTFKYEYDLKDVQTFTGGKKQQNAIILIW